MKTTDWSPGNTPTNVSRPATTTAAKLGALVTTKKATVRRAMCPVAIPAWFSAHTPSANPPAPPLGSSELAACSAIEMS